jgi:hypothetical protein
VPGASLTNWPYEATLRTASRAAQVDGVVSSILGGKVSPETRSILMSGDNPLLHTLPGPDSSGVDPAMTSDDEMQPPRARAAANVGNKGLPRPNAPSPLNRPVDLEGLGQVVGLALGSPEFQRR